MLFFNTNSRSITILIHVLTWTGFGLLLSFFPLSWNIIVPYQVWIKQGIVLLSLIAVFYLNARILVPKLLLKNKNGLYFLAIIALGLIVVLVSTYTDNWFEIPRLVDEAFHKKGPPPRVHHKDHSYDASTIAAMVTASALVIGVGTSITAVQKWQNDRQLHQQMEQEKISSELSFLKAQINPHFFFNTLNNIYALTHIDVNTSRKAIHQLSRMMRYVLYDTQNSTTMLSQEIAFVNDYISLMQLRLTDVVKINFTSPALLKDAAVAPMIFLPFIENAFKHGVSTTQQSFIDIAIEQESQLITLRVDNTIIKEQNNSLEQGSGIGLNNTRRRLDLLYPEKYTLLIDEDADANIYSVNLTLNLS